MAEGVLSAVASTVLESLGQLAVEEISSWWGAKHDLKKLEQTMRMIMARLRDVDKHHEETNSDAVKEWVGRLRCLLYRADDLFDNVFTIEQEKQQIRGSKLFILFLRLGFLTFDRNLAREIKFIRKELDDIKSDMENLNLRVYYTEDSQNLSMTSLVKNRETASFVRVDDIIGREIDRNKIIDMLFDPCFEMDSVSVIPIVGFGGIGKTTLAQLVFDDERVKNHFELRKWTYVPDVNKNKVVLGKVFESLSGNNHHEDLSLEHLQSGIRDSIKNKRYLLVLDDIWEESSDTWDYVMNLLRCGAHGSKVIVTTRSDKVAKVVGTIPEAYKLGTLSDDDSWDLFKRLTLEKRRDNNKVGLIRIGKDIVRGCGNVPLAIRSIGSLLCSSDSEKEWLLLKDAQFLKANQKDDDSVMQSLKLSYDFLPPQLKQCFAYCSLFPKGYLFYKNELVYLWMAQGFIQPLSDGDGLNVGDWYFLELLRRNFFQDVIEDDTTNNIRSRMHDLLHDLAQYVASDETVIVQNKIVNQFTDSILHVSIILDPTKSSTEFWEARSSLCSLRQIRSFILRSTGIITEESTFATLILRCRSLRALDLKSSGIYRLPDSIGTLRHLRYLNLSKNPIRCLPDAITRLVNLQTLNLADCHHLVALPKHFTTLINLRHLNIYSCPFIDMPQGFEMMKSLRKLNMFVVGKNNGLDALPALNLCGILLLKFYRWRKDAVSEARGTSLRFNQRLTHLSLDLKFQEEDIASYGKVEEMFECFKLPSTLKFLRIDGYSGVRFPGWMVDQELPCFLPNLVYVRIENCRNCKLLPQFSQLPHLKALYLSCLEALEYIDDTLLKKDDEMCFPSLQELDLSVMDKLKGWSRVQDEDDVSHQKLFLPRLSKLRIEECQKLISMPMMPKLETFYARGVHVKLLETLLTASTHSALKKLRVSFLEELVTFPSNNQLCNLDSLVIGWCGSLRDLSDQLQNLSTLRKLEISGCEELDLWNINRDDNFRAWKGLKSLRSLSISYNSKSSYLPDGLVHLAMLRQLEIVSFANLTALPEQISLLSELCVLRITNCPKLASIPQSFRSLTSLQELVIMHCPLLEGRCQGPDGEDQSLVQHIRHVQLGR